MAVAIRLSRHGTKKRPYYHIVAVDSRAARDSGTILETVGKYDPMQPKGSETRVVLKADKIKAWLAKGAKASDRVYRFIADAGLVAKKAIPVQTKKNQQSEKTLMKIKDKEAKLAKAKEAEAEALAAANPAPVEEAPAETPAPEAAPEVVTEAPAEAPAETPAEPVAEEAAVEAPAEPAAE